jgi:acyl-CoA oxidase
MKAADLQRVLDGDYREIREFGRELLADDRFQLPLAPTMEEHRELVWGWAKMLAENGQTGLGFPEAYGGQGDVGGSIAAFGMLGFGDLSLLVKCGVQFGLFGGAVLHLGTEKHHKRYLADVASLELPGCFAMTETGHGSNVQQILTTAIYDAEAGEFVVNTPERSARKDYIGNAARDGRMAAVFAQLGVGGESHGVHCLLVPIRDEQGNVLPGITIEDCGHKLGLNGVDNGRICFDDVRVPRDALLDRYAQVREDGTYFSEIENANRRFFTMLGTLIQGRISVGGASISATKSALAIAIRHADERRQFGPPDGPEEALLLDYRTHQRRLLPALATTYALHFAQEELIKRLHGCFSGDDECPERERRELETHAAGVKALATWHATATIQECRECCGGAGYMTANRFAALKADTDVFTTFEGDNTVLLQLVAKSLLTDYKDNFGELDPLGTVQFVANQVIETIVERTAAREIVNRIADEVLRRRTEDEDLRSREFQQALFAWREDHIVSGLARRLKGLIDKGGDPFEVFIECQDHVLLAARAHVERVILDAFAAAVDRVEDPELHELLDRLCDLHALWKVEQDRAWFQEHGRLSSTRSKAVLRTVNELCAEVRPHARLLVDGFGIPEKVLSVPVGQDAADGRQQAAA